MLAAHLVLGYFAVVATKKKWKSEWSSRQRVVLWIAALGSTFAPDLDVIYNTLFRGFVNHSVLWTHSIFLHFGIALCWWLVWKSGRFYYLQMVLGLVTIGGLSHLFLDVISHSTPLFYPLSLAMIGAPSQRVLEGGFPGYITDPIFMAEPIFFAIAIAHWIITRNLDLRIRRFALLGLVSGTIAFIVIFLLALPTLQRIIAA